MASTSLAQTDLKPIAERYGVFLLILFGSQATGKTHPHSDADIAFLSERRLSPRETAEFAFSLSQELRTPSVDPIDLRDAPPLLLRNIAGASRLLYEREPQLFARFNIYALKRYMEAQRLLALRQASLGAFLHHP